MLWAVHLYNYLLYLIILVLNIWCKSMWNDKKIGRKLWLVAHFVLLCLWFCLVFFRVSHTWESDTDGNPDLLFTPNLLLVQSPVVCCVWKRDLCIRPWSHEWHLVVSEYKWLSDHEKKLWLCLSCELPFVDSSLNSTDTIMADRCALIGRGSGYLSCHWEVWMQVVLSIRDGTGHY